MTTENFASELHQPPLGEGIDMADLYVERNVVFMRKTGQWSGRSVRSTDSGKMNGASRETVSRMSSDLEDRGLIEIEYDVTMRLYAGDSLIY